MHALQQETDGLGLRGSGSNLIKLLVKLVLHMQILAQIDALLLSVGPGASTPAYLVPEQIKSRALVTIRSNIIRQVMPVTFSPGQIIDGRDEVRPSILPGCLRKVRRRGCSARKRQEHFSIVHA